MEVNGLKLPDSFVQVAEAIRRETLSTSWELKADRDAYDHPWETDLD